MTKEPVLLHQDTDGVCETGPGVLYRFDQTDYIGALRVSREYMIFFDQVYDKWYGHVLGPDGWNELDDDELKPMVSTILQEERNEDA